MATETADDVNPAAGDQLLERAGDALATAQRMGDAIGTLIQKLEDDISVENYDLYIALEACLEKHQNAVRPIREAVDEVIARPPSAARAAPRTAASAPVEGDVPKNELDLAFQVTAEIEVLTNKLRKELLEIEDVLPYDFGYLANSLLKVIKRANSVIMSVVGREGLDYADMHRSLYGVRPAQSA